MAARAAAATFRLSTREKRISMALIGEPISAAVSGNLVARVAPNQEPGVANAVYAKARLGDVGQRVWLGFFGKAPAGFVACEKKEVLLVKDAPPRVARLSLAKIKLRDRAGPMVRRLVTLRPLSEEVLHRGRGKAISESLVLYRMGRLADNQLAVANQADHAISLKREPFDRIGLCPCGLFLRGLKGDVIANRLARYSRQRIAERRRIPQAPSNPDGWPRRPDSGDDDRGRESRQIEREGQLLVHIGTQLERYKRLSRVLHHGRMRKRFASMRVQLGHHGPVN